MNLPESFVNAIKTDNHIVNGDISVTQLIDAPQIRQLKKTNDYEMDVLDMVGMLLGTGFHTVLQEGDFKGTFQSRDLQKAAGILKSLGEDKGEKYILKVIEDKLKEKINTDVIVEQTLTIEIDGMIISGTFDRFTQSLGLLEDYKTTSASSMMFPETKKQYAAQLNIYAAMLRENGYDVKAARIIAVLKDFSKMKIMTNRDYPKEPVVMMDINLIPHDKVISYLKKRVALHKRAEQGESIPCSKKDRWAKADVFKVKKKGGKRSLKNHLSLEDAKKFIDINSFKYKEPLWIDHVKAESFRCAKGYCSMASICPQYAEEKRKAAEEADTM